MISDELRDEIRKIVCEELKEDRRQFLERMKELLLTPPCIDFYEELDTVIAKPSKQSEFAKLCAPLIEHLHKHWHPHTRIIIDWDRVSLCQEECGVPFQVPD